MATTGGNSAHRVPAAAVMGDMTAQMMAKSTTKQMAPIWIPFSLNFFFGAGSLTGDGSGVGWVDVEPMLTFTETF